MKKNRILVLWYTEDQNFGDVLIFDTVKEHLVNSGYEVDYMDVGMPCIEIFNKANEYNFLLFGGGGIIERWVPNVLRYFKEDFNILRVPYGVMGLSIGDFNYDQYKETLSLFVEKSLFFYTRDRYTADYFNNLIAEEKAIYTADVVFASNKFCEINELGKKIGANFRDVPYKDLTGDLKWDSWSEVLNSVGVDKIISDTSSEEQRLRIDRVEGGNEIYNYDNIINQISSARIVIAMRFHVILVAAMLGIIPIPINYCPKVGRLSEQLGLEEITLGINDSEKLVNKMEYVLENEEQIKTNLHNNIIIMKKRANQMFSDVINILKKGIV